MFYVYVLESKVNKDIYVGFSRDLRTRLKNHNSGQVMSTKPNIPWRLIYYESYLDKRDATKRGRQLKNHRAKLDLKSQLRHSLK